MLRTSAGCWSINRPFFSLVLADTLLNFARNSAAFPRFGARERNAPSYWPGVWL